MNILEQVKQAVGEIQQAPKVPINLTIGVPLPIMVAGVEGFQRGQLAAIKMVGRARKVAHDFLQATGGMEL